MVGGPYAWTFIREEMKDEFMSYQRTTDHARICHLSVPVSLFSLCELCKSNMYARSQPIERTAQPICAR